MEAGVEASNDTDSMRYVDDGKQREEEAVRIRLREAMAQLDDIEVRDAEKSSCIGLHTFPSYQPEKKAIQWPPARSAE
jgi:hypothetical protein